MASTTSAESNPPPDAPAMSAVRVIAMSTRPVAASMRGVNVVATPPCRMNVPSCAVRTRSTFALYVTVKVITDSRDTLLIEIGTVYGPLATRNSGPAVTITWAVVAAAGVAVPGAAGGVVVTSRGEVVAPTAPPAGVVAGATPGAVAAGGGAPTGLATGGSGVTSV